MIPKAAENGPKMDPNLTPRRAPKSSKTLCFLAFSSPWPHVWGSVLGPILGPFWAPKRSPKVTQNRARKPAQNWARKPYISNAPRGAGIVVVKVISLKVGKHQNPMESGRATFQSAREPIIELKVGIINFQVFRTFNSAEPSRSY